jgi:hypothetical protein
MLDRERAGVRQVARVACSTAVNAPAAQERGFDGGKRIVGRKRYVAIDGDGRLLMVNITAADAWLQRIGNTTHSKSSWEQTVELLPLHSLAAEIW